MHIAESALEEAPGNKPHRPSLGEMSQKPKQQPPEGLSTEISAASGRVQAEARKGNKARREPTEELELRYEV